MFSWPWTHLLQVSHFCSIQLWIKTLFWTRQASLNFFYRLVTFAAFNFESNFFFGQDHLHWTYHQPYGVEIMSKRHYFTILTDTVARLLELVPILLQPVHLCKSVVHIRTQHSTYEDYNADSNSCLIWKKLPWYICCCFHTTVRFSNKCMFMTLSFCNVVVRGEKFLIVSHVPRDNELHIAISSYQC